MPIFGNRYYTLKSCRSCIGSAEDILYVPAPFNSHLITPKQDGVHLLLNDNGLVLYVIYVDSLMGCLLDQWNVAVHNLQNVQHVSIVLFALE